MSTDAPSRSQTIAKNSLWLLLDALCSVAVSFGMSIAVARALDPSVLGLYNYVIWLANSAASTLSIGAILGMQRFAAEAYGRGDIQGLKEILHRGLRWQILISAALVVIGFSLLFLVETHTMRVAIALIIVGLAPMLWMGAPSAGLAATQRFDLAVLPSMAGILVNLSLSVAALVMEWGLVGLTAALLAARIVDCAIRFVVWRRLLRTIEARAVAQPPVETPSADVRERHLKFVWRSSVLLLLDLIIWERSEFLVLSHFRPLEDLAFFSLAFNIVQQALMVPKMLSWSLAANFMAEQGRDSKRVIALTSDAIRYVSLVVTPMVLGLAAIAPSVIPLLYGARYSHAIPVLTIVAFFAMVRGLHFSVQELLQMSERQVFLIRFGIVMAFVSFGLDFAFIPNGGPVGAAWANGLGQCVATFGLLAYAVIRLGLRPPVGPLLRILASCLPMVIAARTISMFTTPLTGTLLGIAIGSLLYLLGLRVMGVLHRTDVDRLGSVERLLPSALRPRWRGLLCTLARD